MGPHPSQMAMSVSPLPPAGHRYTCEALKTAEAIQGGWAICGVGMMPQDAAMRDALVSQDNMYTVLSRGQATNEARVVGAITKYMLAPDDPAAVVAQMAASTTKIVSLTITEKGYCASDLGAMKLDAAHPFVLHDATTPLLPKSGLGFVVTALARRRANGEPPFTVRHSTLTHQRCALSPAPALLMWTYDVAQVLSCDNLQGNGTTARTLTLAMAEKMAPSLGAAGEGLVSWIESSVPFPNSMVDRITPATTDEVRAAVAGHGVQDEWPVTAEDYAQWVIEDDFPLGRPPWEKAAPVGAESAALLVEGASHR
jgi:mannitol 2-dehydrogenase